MKNSDDVTYSHFTHMTSLVSFVKVRFFELSSHFKFIINVHEFVNPNGGVQESANNSAPRGARKNLLADLEAP
jgi:hypothetical protein